MNIHEKLKNSLNPKNWITDKSILTSNLRVQGDLKLNIT